MKDNEFSEEEKQKLEEDMKNKVLAQFSGVKDILDYIEFTLSNFSYRYLESESTGKISVNWQGQDSGAGGSLSVAAFESELAQSLKTKNVKTRKGIIDMAKISKKADRPMVAYKLCVSWDDLGQNDVTLLAYAEVNWDFPEFKEATDKKNHLEKTFHYSDSFEMRNNFPRELEDVCDVF